MRLLIYKQVTGFPYDVILQDGMLKPAQELEEHDFCVGDLTAPAAIEDLLRLYGYEVPDLIPREYKNSFKECGYTGDVPWSYVIPTPRFKQILMPFLKDIQEMTAEVSKSEYSSFFQDTNALFSMLEPCTLNEKSARSILENEDNHVLNSFVSSSVGGSLPVPQYSRSSTKTGRLVVKSGPQILTMKKDHRAVLRASSRNKKLYEIDFVSLEPRVALNIAGADLRGDVYTSFSENLGLGISRDAAKLAVLCTLYGAGKYRLESMLRDEGSDIPVEKLMKEVANYFKVDSLSKSLSDQAKTGSITNLFGRPIEVDDQRPSILVNNFLQSTAVDVSLAGFLDFCRQFAGVVKPLFIIHDALLFEADPKKLTAVSEYVSNGYDMQGVGKFPLKITELNSNE